MNLRAFYHSLCRLYPVSDACPGDFDGLQLCPDETRKVEKIVCALDLCADSVNAAIREKADLLLTHHPVFYGGARTLDPQVHPENKNVTALLSAGIAHISLHTRFDAGNGGMNDTLCKLLGLQKVRAVGLEDEKKPLGRIGDTKEPADPERFAAFVAETLGTDVLFTPGADRIRRVLVVTGSGKDYANLFLLSDADAFVSGELAHHIRVAAHDSGRCLIEAGHYGTEHIFNEAIAPVIRKLDDSIELVSFSDTPRERTIRTP